MTGAQLLWAYLLSRILIRCVQFQHSEKVRAMNDQFESYLHFRLTDLQFILILSLSRTTATNCFGLKPRLKNDGTTASFFERQS